MRKLFVVAVALLAVGALTARGGITIDNFEEDNSATSASDPWWDDTTENWSLSASNVIGGVRQLYTAASVGSVGSFFDSAVITNTGLWAVSEGLGIQGHAAIWWDGTTNQYDGGNWPFPQPPTNYPADPDNWNTNVDVYGLGGVDLTVGGNDRFHASLYVDHDAYVRIDVWSGVGGTMASSNMFVPQMTGGLTSVYWDFADFTSAGVDMTDVGAVRMSVMDDGDELQSSVDFLEAVPEPGTLSLMGLGLLFGLLRRKRS